MHCTTKQYNTRQEMKCNAMQCKKMYADIKTPVTCDAVKRKHSSMLKTSNGEQPIQSSSQSSYR